MDHFVVTAAPDRQRTDCAIVGVYDKGALSTAAQELDRRCGGALARVIKRGDFRGKVGETLLVSELKGSPAARVVLVGLGASDKLNRKQYRKATASGLAIVLKSGARDAVSYLSLEKTTQTDAYYRARFVADAAANALYRTPDLKTAKKPPVPALKSLGVAVADRADKANAERGLRDGAGIAVGMTFMRDLANLPPNVCTPTYLANAAKTLARYHRNVTVKILGELEMRKLKMGALLAVTAGSEEPAKFILAEYRGGKSGDAPIVLVGKGVTFDTGGISLKPPPGMDEMKFDMSGAATVLGVLKAAAELKLPINLVAAAPACENMPNGRATKPGDIVKTMSGQTVEILNTDAEGRLILCDALTYVRRYKP
ncbi:MAG TPA: leucyl aminopeptidase, partial [Steroidobacteraceae bacterium]|nr:leucyl aminopeptidase [Steroidobacteraceae bacterium]